MRQHDKDANAFMGDFSDLVINYFRLFGDKPCCTHDISLFLPAISITDRQELANKLLAESGISSTNLPKDVSCRSYKISFKKLYFILFLFVFVSLTRKNKCKNIFVLYKYHEFAALIWI